MSSTNLETQTLNLKTLLSSGKIYKVPQFQRDYSWTEIEWEDLWNDLLALSEEQIHYMGYIVLQSNDEKEFEIIDGQQRFATISVLALAIIKNLNDFISADIEPQNNRERIDELHRTFLGYKDPSSLISRSKLALNNNNNDFYQNNLLRLNIPKKSSSLKPSEKLLLKAFRFFEEKIRNHFTKKEGAEIASFLNDLVGEKLVFTYIFVSNNLSAYKVFETLNARGVKLSTTDLLKNYLFSILAKTSGVELKAIERQWQIINNCLVGEDLPTFTRYYWNSTHPLVRKPLLYKEISQVVNTKEVAFTLLNELEKYAPFHVALSRPDDAEWNKEQRQLITELSLYRVSQCYPLLYSAWANFNDQEFTKLLRLVVVISFRYNVIGSLNTNILEVVYSKVANKITSHDITTTRQAFEELRKGIYVNDEAFTNNFATKYIDTTHPASKKIARFILCKIESYLSKKEIDDDSTIITIEHILPENPSNEWNQFFKEEEMESYVYQLGNLTLMNSKQNGDIGNKLFSEKSKVYPTSEYLITSNEIKFDEWTPVTLRKRQQKLAEYATQIWRFDN